MFSCFTGSLDNLKLPSIRLSRPAESSFYGSPLSKKSFQSLSPRGKFDRSSKHSSPVSSRMFTPDLGYLKLPILQQAVRCKIEPYEYWDGRRTKSAVDCVANLHFLTEEELAQFDQRLLAIGRRTSFSSDTVKRHSSPTGYRAIRTQTIRGLTYNSKSAESLTFHVDHNRERNSFKLPTEKLKKNKKWKVTFTIGKSKKDKKGKTKELDKS